MVYYLELVLYRTQLTSHYNLLNPNVNVRVYTMVQDADLNVHTLA
jgi:hypothetical protein